MVRWQNKAPIILAITICFPICSPAQQQNQSSSESRSSFPARLQVNRNLSISKSGDSRSGNSYWQNGTENTPAKLQYTLPNGPDSVALKQTGPMRLARELSSAGKGVRRQQDDLSIIKAVEKSAMDDLLADEERELNGLTLRDWPRQTIGEIPIDPRDLSSQVPADLSAPLINRFARNWSQFESTEKIYKWEAPNIYYRPLYFEDVALERYGQTFKNDHWQTAISAAHFFSSACLLPLHMRLDPIRACDYPLGYCRPGNCTNRIWQRQFWGLHHLHHRAGVK